MAAEPAGQHRIGRADTGSVSLVGEPHPGVGPTKTARPTAKPTPFPANVPKRPKDAQQLSVTYVYDGDTLQLKADQPGRYVTKPGQFKVRLIGVNAPEMTPQKECFAQQATNRLLTLAPKGRRSGWAPASDSWDDYRRRLFYVWLPDERMLDYELVAGGYGRALRIWPNVKHATLLEQTEKKARTAQRGLWKSC